jgi:EmrB/QacA subfamily drug resistance transporter
MRSTWAILAITGLGAFIAALDQTVVVTALPSVMLDLKIPITELDRVSWIITAYLLGYTVAMPLIGRLGDVYGYPRVYQASLIVFCIGTSLVAVAPNFEWMIGARVIQAVGGGGTVPIGMALAVSLVPPERRALALGVVGGAAEAGSMLGPAYGGAIVALANWRWLFWLNLPQVLMVAPLLLLLPHRRQAGVRVDYLGGGLALAMLLALSLGLAQKGLFTLDSAWPLGLLGMGLALAAALVFWERRTTQPLLLPLLFRTANFVTANLTQLLVGVSLVIALVMVPLLANTVMGKDPFTGALWLLRMTVAIPVGAMAGGLLLSRVGNRPVIAAGLLLIALGLFLVSGWPLDVAEPELTLHLLIAGLGYGLVIAPIMAQALNAAPSEYHATASSMVVVARLMGMTLGLAALAAYGIGHFQSLTGGLALPLPVAGESPAETAARVAAYAADLQNAGLSLFHRFFRIAAVVALLGLLPLLPGLRRNRLAK